MARRAFTVRTGAECVVAAGRGEVLVYDNPVMEIAAIDIPPIVLLVDNEDDERTLCSNSLQESGYWVAAAADPEVAIHTAAELQPDIIVAGITPDGRRETLRFIRAMTEHRDTRNTPLVVLSGRPVESLPRGAREHAAAVLVKPVAPDVLARKIHHVLAGSRRAQECLIRPSAETGTVPERSDLARHRPAAPDARGDDRLRNCPACGGRLAWLERGSIGGADYDFYRWCSHKCGLYCYDRTARQFVKLA
jgi:CheY-like chemotaxis protein